MKRESQWRTLLVATVTGVALLGGTVTAAAEPAPRVATITYEHPSHSAATIDRSGLVLGDRPDVFGAQPEAIAAEVRLTALPLMLIWAIFRALVQRYGPVIAKEILCAQYGVCW